MATKCVCTILGDSKCRDSCTDVAGTEDETKLIDWLRNSVRMDKAEEAVWWLLGCVLGGASGQKADACTQR